MRQECLYFLRLSPFPSRPAQTRRCREPMARGKRPKRLPGRARPGPAERPPEQPPRRLLAALGGRGGGNAGGDGTGRDKPCWRWPRPGERRRAERPGGLAGTAGHGKGCQEPGGTAGRAERGAEGALLLRRGRSRARALPSPGRSQCSGAPARLRGGGEAAALRLVPPAGAPGAPRAGWGFAGQPCPERRSPGPGPGTVRERPWATPLALGDAGGGRARPEFRFPERGRRKVPWPFP